MEPSGSRFQNVAEWLVWQEVKENAFLRRWFAPCIRISPFGGHLLMDRTKPVTMEQLKRLVPKVPAFFTDLKTGNWGMLRGMIVCHDYGSLLVTDIGLTRRLKKAKWWAES